MKYWVVYTENLPPDVGGSASGPIIRIKPRFWNDVGIHKHEETHVNQWLLVTGLVLALGAFLYYLQIPVWPFVIIVSGVVNSTLYSWVRKYRLWTEVAAYREQMRWPDGNGVNLSAEDAAARLLSSRYNLGLTQEQAMFLLS